MRRVPIKFHHGQRGAAAPVVTVAVILILVALAAWFLIIRPNLADRALANTQQATTTAAAAASSAQAPTVDVQAMGVDELINEAKKAMNDRRIIAPAGNNAFEYYLGVLEKLPGDLVAQDALRETFPFAASAAEQAINDNDFTEAQREIDLLAKADPGNYTLTILRSKLDAQRKLAARVEEQQKRAEELAAQQQTPSQESASNEATQPEAEETTEQVAAAPVAPAQQPAAEPAEPVPTPAAPVTGPTRGPLLVKSTQPVYPPAALRSRQTGWVDVQFTVDVSGEVQNVRAVGSQRGRVFERAATDAVRQWRFEPALENGQPIPRTLVQRIEFNL